jgi:hypothetical protein
VSHCPSQFAHTRHRQRKHESRHSTLCTVLLHSAYREVPHRPSAGRACCRRMRAVQALGSVRRQSVTPAVRSRAHARGLARPRALRSVPPANGDSQRFVSGPRALNCFRRVQSAMFVEHDSATCWKIFRSRVVPE